MGVVRRRALSAPVVGGLSVGLAVSGDVPALAASAPGQLLPEIAVHVVCTTSPSVVGATAAGSTDTVPIIGGPVAKIGAGPGAAGRRRLLPRGWPAETWTPWY